MIVSMVLALAIFLLFVGLNPYRLGDD